MARKREKSAPSSSASSASSGALVIQKVTTSSSLVEHGIGDVDTLAGRIGGVEWDETNAKARKPVDERLPAKAHRELVLHERDERKAPAALYIFFSAYNAAFFQNALMQAIILITDCPLRALGDYCPADANGLRSRIRLQPKMWDLLDREEHRVHIGRLAADVLLHEMVHAWQHEIVGDLEAGYRGHGPVFASKCNQIGALLGLAPVSPKGRHGRPDCAQWPMVVRPIDYYGDLLAPKPKKDRKKSTSNGQTEHDERDDGSLTSRLLDCLARIEGTNRGEYLENLLRREAVAHGPKVREVDPELADFLGV